MRGANASLTAFDRLIAAHAIVAGAPLVTADETIRDNLPLATWG